MGFLQVCAGLVGREVNRPFDAIEREPYHVLRAGEIPIALAKFFRRDGFLAAHVTCDVRLGEQGVNPMD